MKQTNPIVDDTSKTNVHLSCHWAPGGRCCHCCSQQSRDIPSKEETLVNAWNEEQLVDAWKEEQLVDPWNKETLVDANVFGLYHFSLISFCHPCFLFFAHHPSFFRSKNHLFVDFDNIQRLISNLEDKFGLLMVWQNNSWQNRVDKTQSWSK